MKVDTLTLAQSTIDVDTKNIEVNNLLVDYASTMVIFSPKYIKALDHVKTNQFTYYTSYDYTIKEKVIGYRIWFDEDFIKYEILYEENEEISLLDSKSIPSSFAKSFAIIPQAGFIQLFSSGPNVKTVKDFNVTIKRYDPFNFSYMIKKPYKNAHWPETYETFEIDQVGDWSGVTNSPKIYITYDTKKTDVKLPETFANFKVSQEEFYKYTSKSDQLMDDDNGYDDFVVPGQTVVEVDVSNKTNDEIQSIIDTTLSTGFNETDKKDKVVDINKPIDFVSKKEYDDNEWTKFSSGSKITLESGNLNIILPDQGDISVEVKDADNIKLKINGKGTLNLNSTDQNKKSFTRTLAAVAAVAAVAIMEKIRKTAILKRKLIKLQQS